MTKDELQSQVTQIENYQTVVQQEEYTQQKLQEMIEKRKENLQEIIQKDVVPLDARIFSYFLGSPLILGGLALNYFYYNNLIDDNIILSTQNYVKYLGIMTTFQGGIHWGFSMSIHDLQIDSVNSSPEARNHFLKASACLFMSFYGVSGITYLANPSIIEQSLYLAVLTGANFFIMYLDKQVCKQGIAPKWFWKLKVELFLFQLFGLANVVIFYFYFKEKYGLKMKIDHYNKIAPQKEDLLRDSMKISQVQQVN